MESNVQFSSVNTMAPVVSFICL